MRRALFVTIAVAAVGTALTLVMPALAGGGGCHGDETEANSSVVELRHSCFKATVTHVDRGTQVAFVNRDPFTHNVMGFGAIWGDIEGFGGGETRLFTFDETGIFPYACTLHPGMVGAVVVGGDETIAGDAGTVVAANSTGSGGPGGATSVGARESAPTGSWLPEAVLGLVLVTALAGGLALLARRRAARQRAIRSAI
jgi:plastocyanin